MYRAWNQVRGWRNIPRVIVLVLVVLTLSACSDSSYNGPGPSEPYTPTANSICTSQKNDAIDACYASSCSSCAGFGCLVCWDGCTRSTTVWTTYYSCCQSQGCVQSISGYVKTGSGAGLDGVTMSYTGESPVYTDASGYYSFPDVGAGTLTPSKSGFCFTPASQYYPMSYSILSSENFTARQTCFSISGTITSSGGSPLPDVTVNLAGASTATVVTNASGGFAFNGLAPGSYTVTPDYFGLSPINQNIDIVSSSQTGVDFTVTGRTISGRVNTSNGAGIAGITVTLSGDASATSVTDQDGAYVFAGLGAGSYTLTPQTACTTYAFDTASIAAAIVFTDVTGQDFLVTPSPYDLAGTVSLNGSPLSGVTLTRSPAPTSSTTTDGFGQYGFSAIQDSVFNVLTPTMPGYLFAPARREALSCSDPVGPLDFDASTSWIRETQELYGRPAIHALSGGGYLATTGSKVVRLDQTGATVWAKDLGNAGTYYTSTSIKTFKEIPGTGFILAGAARDGTNPGNSLSVVALMNDDGTIAWQKRLGNYPVSNLSAAVGLAAGGYVLAFNSASDVWVVKLDTSGNVVWQKLIGGPDWDGAEDIDVDAGGNVVVVGGTGSFGAVFGDFWMFKLDGSGNLVWQKRFGGDQVDRAYAVRATGDGGFLVGGESYSFGGTGVLVKVDTNGAITWQKAFANRGIFDIDTTADGNFVVLGKTDYFEAWLMKMDGAGNPAWQRKYAASQSIDYSDSLEVDEITGGGFMIGGDRLLIRTNGFGDLDACTRDQVVAITSADINGAMIDTDATVSDTSIATVDIGFSPVVTSFTAAQTCPAP